MNYGISHDSIDGLTPLTWGEVYDLPEHTPVLVALYDGPKLRHVLHSSAVDVYSDGLKCFNHQVNKNGSHSSSTLNKYHLVRDNNFEWYQIFTDPNPPKDIQYSYKFMYK